VLAYRELGRAVEVLAQQLIRPSARLSGFETRCPLWGNSTSLRDATRDGSIAPKPAVRLTK